MKQEIVKGNKISTDKLMNKSAKKIFNDDRKLYHNCILKRRN